jgi:dihydroorotase (multifunctional complex type)
LTVDLVLSNTKAYINKEIVPCSFAIENGKIHKIGKEPNMPKAEKKMDLKGLAVLPGLIDVHVHLRDEGKAYKEDFYTGTAAAAAGGITTVLDMPNNNPVTMSKETLKNRMETAANKILVNVGFYSEFPKDMKEITDIAKEAVAFKLYMTEQIGGLNIEDDYALLEAFRAVGKLGIPVAVHAEDKSLIKKAEEAFRRANRNDIEAYLQAHSANAETKAVKRLLNIIKQTDVHIHFCHVSTANGLEAIVEGKKLGLPITCEVTPHHLFLSVDDLSQIGTLALTMPPVREKRHIAALWDGIKNGWVDVVASDHAPHALHEKEAEVVWNVKVGITGLETMLPLLLTEVERGRLSLAEVVRLVSEKPAEIFKLKGRGCLKEGNVADFTVVDLKRKYKIDASKFHSKAKYSPFDGCAVGGKPVKTFVRGLLVMDEGEIVAKPGSGEIFRREKP